MTSHFFFLLGFCFLLVHEMDAVGCRERKILPGLNRMEEEAGYLASTALHVPLYTLLLWGLDLPRHYGHPNIEARRSSEGGFECQGQHRDIEGLVASPTGIEEPVSVVYEAEEHGHGLFQGRKRPGMLRSGHPELLWSSSGRIAFVLLSILATRIQQAADPWRRREALPQRLIFDLSRNPLHGLRRPVQGHAGLFMLLHSFE